MVNVRDVMQGCGNKTVALQLLHWPEVCRRMKNIRDMMIWCGNKKTALQFLHRPEVSRGYYFHFCYYFCGALSEDKMECTREELTLAQFYWLLLTCLASVSLCAYHLTQSEETGDEEKDLDGQFHE
ncbi:hypothetical protein NDU88_007179 [Pleurodeles waltl]|uniref:Uncharacterized protein n=1 Tax=Pleurodeles waltl TaxID=8319 RepID=A0AAV7SRN0_PLEWA|nr:hypothetical protein NDU88_007179 [Pleurodeles waltl]